MSNKYRHYGTKRYAMNVLRAALREYAKSQRAFMTRAVGDYRYEASKQRNSANLGMVIGAWSALKATGAITEAQYQWVGGRIARISNAKVTRRPFVEVLP